MLHVDRFGIPLNDNVLLNDVLLNESPVKRKQQYEKSKRNLCPIRELRESGIQLLAFCMQLARGLKLK